MFISILGQGAVDGKVVMDYNVNLIIRMNFLKSLLKVDLIVIVNITLLWIKFLIMYISPVGSRFKGEVSRNIVGVLENAPGNNDL